MYRKIFVVISFKWIKSLTEAFEEVQNLYEIKEKNSGFKISLNPFDFKAFYGIKPGALFIHSFSTQREKHA